jgi:hypothetical protein
MSSSDFDVVTGPPVPIRPHPRATVLRGESKGVPPADPSRAPAEPVPQARRPAPPAAPSEPSAGRR